MSDKYYMIPFGHRWVLMYGNDDGSGYMPATRAHTTVLRTEGIFLSDCYHRECWGGAVRYTRPTNKGKHL